MTDSEKYHAVLRKYWGYDSFRPLQEKIIDEACKGNDVLGLMPTGGGKSITFQVPALCMDGTCIVVTPLIALMKDQVDNLRNKGILATTVYSGMSKDEIETAFGNCILGGYKFLYISPERLSTDLFLEKVKRMKVSLLVVDESHCISQWGYDFRPSYLKIADVREVLPPTVPVMALTATATPAVVEDIQNQLHFRKHNLLQKSFARKNIAYVVRKTDDKLGQMLHILNSVEGTSIVYVRNRKRTKEIADILKKEGLTADHFHAGLAQETKDRKQEAWKRGDCRVIVSTNAFGMGIDKPDVRTVIHIDLPDSLEAYFQEAGRAGRDEKKAYAVLLYDKADISKLKKRLADSFPDRDFIVQVYRELCCYFEIGVGEGTGFQKDFNLFHFCQVFHLPSVQTFSALKILQQAGYVELTDEITKKSRIMFKITKEEVYHHSLEYDEKLDDILNLLLRSYTGLFAEYAEVDEDMMSSRLDLNRDDLYHKLSELARLGILSYIPGKTAPFIFFPRRRVDDKYVVIGKEVYEGRKGRFRERVEKVISYVEDNSHCRSRMLLQYFGEFSSDNCGMCDYCISKNDLGISHTKMDQIRQFVMNRVAQTPLPISDLTHELERWSFQPIQTQNQTQSQTQGQKQSQTSKPTSSVPLTDETLLSVLRWMLDEGEIQMDDEGRVIPNASFC